MSRIGLREVRQRASELLRRVAAGETIEITDRGPAVALLVPIVDGSPLDRVRAAGEVTVATESVEDLPSPLQVPAGKVTPSEHLARLRRNER